MFPLTGESFIAVGGRERKQNPAHILVPDQRFAIDIVALAPGSKSPDADKLVDNIVSGKITTYKDSDPKVNASHYCFGRPIVAPGDGTVVDVLDGVHVNIPGERNKKDIPGNYVVIEHGNGEFSMLAHFRNGSVRVQKKQKVLAGDPLGECGNSGHSNLPHLHYHLQNTPRWLDGEGLPAQFQHY
ncbi:MAG: M23 family metallopeptidase [Gammaproteobacteria bacterium]|nr:M23 family metallopeptidase [Gammaproteobacteria bacterium]